MKTYLLFAGRTHDGLGGWVDFVCSKDTLAEIKETLLEHRFVGSGNPIGGTNRFWRFDWYQVVERDTGKCFYAEYNYYKRVFRMVDPRPSVFLFDPLEIDLLLTREDLESGDVESGDSGGIPVAIRR